MSGDNSAVTDFWNGQPVSVSRELIAPRCGGDLTDVVIIDLLGARGGHVARIGVTLENAAALAALLDAEARR